MSDDQPVTATQATPGGHAVLADYWCTRMPRDEFALFMMAAGYSDGPTARRAWEEARARVNGSYDPGTGK